MSEQPRGKKQLILEVASANVIAKGFAATSIEEIIAEVGITKSGFFYHFADKNELAKALFRRYIENEDALFNELETRAFELNDDPLHGFLIQLKLLAELLDDLPGGHPGCLIASYCYQARQFSAEVRDLNAKALLGWRARFLARLERIAEVYPKRLDIDLRDLADMLSAVADGGIILSRVLDDHNLLPRQIMVYRELVKAVFLPPQQ